MKRFIKTFWKFFVGIGVLLLAVLVFTQTRKTISLETGKLSDWQKSAVERKMTAVKVLTASNDNLELLVKCVDKIATLPDSADMPVRDATELCFMGIKLKDTING